MPCTLDPWEVEFEEKRIKKERRENELKKPTGFLFPDQLEAVLCGVFTCLSNPRNDHTLEEFLGVLNYEKMGVTRKQVEVWWKKHQERDKKRNK